MRLLIDNGVLFADGLYLCYARSGNARNNLDDGCYSVEIRKDAHRAYIHIDGVGRVGADGSKHDIVLGRVLGRNELLPSEDLVTRLFALVEKSPTPIVMEINNG